MATAIAVANKIAPIRFLLLAIVTSRASFERDAAWA
jgi:hypothetical protein